MSNLAKTSIAALLTVSIVGCTSNEPMNDETQTKTEGTVVGTLLGAALGAAIGGRKGALIGGALGAGAGYAIGSDIAKRKKKYANNEDFLDGEIQYVAEYNENASQYNDKLAKHIKQLDARVAQMQSDYKNGVVKRSQLTAEKKDIKARLKKSKQLLADLKKEYDVNVRILAEQKKTNANDPSIARLEKEVATLKRNINQLQQGTKQLASIDERLSV